MWQKLMTVPAQGAVLLLLTAVLFVLKPYIGEFNLSSNTPNLLAISADPSADVLLNSKTVEPGKMLAGLENPKKRKEVKAQVKRVEVASQTIYKPKAASVPADIEPIIRKYAQVYGANPEVMIIIAKCESGFRPDAISPSGAFHGMYQFVPATWKSNRKAMGLSDDLDLMYNAEEAIKTAAFKMGRDGYGAWPVCSQKAFTRLNIS